LTARREEISISLFDDWSNEINARIIRDLVVPFVVEGMYDAWKDEGGSSV